MNTKNKERIKATSCGALTWRLKGMPARLQVLLIKQFAHHDRWGIPKGHVNGTESHEECALREVREETGVAVVLGGRLPDVYTSFKHEDKTVMSWFAQPTGDDEPKHDDPDSEVADARWFDIGELPDIHPYQREMVTAAVQVLLVAVDDLEERYQPMQPAEPVL